MNKQLNFLKTYRMHKGFLQRNLANQIGVDSSIFSAWESFKALPPVETQNKIAEILCVRVKDIWPD